MTNKDAIYYLQYLRHDVHADSPYDIALVTAINALSSDNEHKKLSNADRIRQMTDEELADKLTDKCSVCAYHYAECETKFCICEEGVLKWLKQEAKDDDAEKP